MTELDAPELNRTERIVRDHILPILPQDYGNPPDLNEQQVAIARSVLSKEYVEHARLSFLTRLILLFVIYDILFVLNSQIYGLVLVMLGSLALALGSFYTPELLIHETVNKPETVLEEIKSKARLTARTNVFVFALSVGFLWQIFVVSGTIPEELFIQNHLQSEVDGWIGFIAIFFVAYPIFRGGIKLFFEKIFH